MSVAGPTPASVKARLIHTWSPFFARHGNFSPVQLHAIPPILDGRHTLVMAATASGKTEAAIAPLVERHLFGPDRLPRKRPSELLLLYISPSRALVRDLYARMALPLEQLGVSVEMKSGDTGPLSILPNVLITTPESTDSLLTRLPRQFAHLQAVILDEIHLLDEGPRGDHLRCLLQRIGVIRTYHSRQSEERAPAPLQRVALSATVADPAGVARRYLSPTDQVHPSAKPEGADVAIVDVPGRRELSAEIVPVAQLEEIAQALLWRAWGVPPAHKSLIFCNTRREVEETATYLRSNLGYETAVFVHYSNLEPALRRTIEEDFSNAASALCVSTSTLELGIDIGDIDDVVLIGPPPSVTSFLQRIGRGNRR